MDWILNGDDERLPELWPGYVDLTPVALDLVLVAAREQCTDFGPVLEDPDVIPARWVIAQALQAKGLTQAGFVGTDGQIGALGEGVVAWPMDWQVKNLLRPKTRPVVS